MKTDLLTNRIELGKLHIRPQLSASSLLTKSPNKHIEETTVSSTNDAGQYGQLYVEEQKFVSRILYKT